MKISNRKKGGRGARNTPLPCPGRNGKTVRLMYASLKDVVWLVLRARSGGRKLGAKSPTLSQTTPDQPNVIHAHGERVCEGHDRRTGMGFSALQGQQICKCNNGKARDATTESTIQFGMADPKGSWARSITRISSNFVIKFNDCNVE